MHRTRVITGIVAIPCFYLLISQCGPFGFALFVSLAAMIGLGEYFRIVFSKSGPPIYGVIPLIGFLATPAIVLSAYKFDRPFEAILGVVVLNLIATGFAALVRFKKDPTVTESVARQVQGLLYVPVLLSTLVLLRNDASYGEAWIYFLLILVASCDTGAYYAGTRYGKHKLCPSVSPGKTIEGFLGGMGLTIVMGIILKFFFLPQLSWGMSFIFFIVISIVGPAGDLFESVLKRTGGIKDSGSIIPGHGGILDRIDALLFVAPVAYLFKVYLL